MTIYNEQINNRKLCRVVRIMMVVFSLFLLSVSAELNAETGAMPSNETTGKSTELFRVEARHVTLLQSVTFQTVKGETAKTNKIVEFRIISSSSIPARGYDPIIVVGKHKVTDYRYIKQNELLFIEYHPESLQDGSDIYFQWGSRPVKQQRWKLSVVYDLKKMKRISVNQLDDLYKSR